MSSCRRGVSEVLASIVLLLIVSVLGTSLYSYSLTAMEFGRNDVRGEVQTEAERAQERFRIVVVCWSGSDDRLSLTILNFGKLEIKIMDVYVNGERVTSYQSGHGEEIYTSRLGQVNFTAPVPITKGVQYEITLVSERGALHVYGWES